jgi:enamine deaminase RidA (YjgF/YER057c/UK114 family)
LALPFPSATSADVAVEMMAFRPAAAAAARRSLHVQSISCWAAACIGPYSQSINAGGLCFLSGQIGLVPATMQLASQEAPGHSSDTNALLHDPRRALVEIQLEEAVRNLSAVLRHHQLSSTDCLSLSCYYVDKEGAEQTTVHMYLTRLADLAVLGRRVQSWFAAEAAVGAVNPCLLKYLQVPALPRGALVEVQAIAGDAKKKNGSKRRCQWAHTGSLLLLPKVARLAQVSAGTPSDPLCFCLSE